MLYMQRAIWTKRKIESVVTPLDPHNVDCFVIHHEGGTVFKKLDQASEMRKMIALENYHVKHNGWSAIAYNFVVFPSGRIYEGRGPARRSAAQGTNLGNSRHIAICLVGDYDKQSATPAVEASILALMRGLTDKYYSGMIENIKVRAHKSFKQTACPGKNGVVLAANLAEVVNSLPVKCCKKDK